MKSQSFNFPQATKVISVSAWSGGYNSTKSGQTDALMLVTTN